MLLRRWLWLCAGLISCTGKISMPEPSGAGGGTAVSACTSAGVDPGPLLMRRLTNAEFQASVQWLLGLDASAEVATFPTDLRTDGFDNAFELQTVSTTHADCYHSAVKSLSDRVFADTGARATLLGCDPGADRDGCTRGFISNFGRRAFRRPLESDEVDRYATLAQTEADPFDGAALALRTMLESPKFLWRVEVGQPKPGSPYLQLTGYEVAARLSFFLWGSPPDDEMLTKAGAGSLDTPEDVEAQARAMLDDPRSRASFERFTDQWFTFDKLPQVTRTASLFPTFGDSLKTSMLREVHTIFSRALWGNQARLLDAYDTRTGSLDAPLAALYGVSGISGGPTDHDWGNDPDRGGLFTTAGLLTVTARNDFTSPIQRGLFLRKTVLCEALSPPAGGVPPISVMPGESQEAAESRHTSDPACSGCHTRIDPVGMGLERYDAIGMLRTAYPDGKPVQQAGKIVGLPKPDYSGGVELGALLASSTEAQQCAVRQTFRWAFGRMDDGVVVDACALEQLNKPFGDSNQSFRELVIAVVKNDAFRLRRPAD